MRRPAVAIVRIWRIVAKRRILDQMPDHVDPEAVDSFAKPEAHHVMDGAAHFRIAPVQVRLLGKKCVIIILPRGGVIFQALPPNSDSQLFGSPPSAAGSRQMYQSRFGLLYEARLSMNQGCWSEVWLGTRSRMTLSPLACAAFTSASKSAIVPNSGSMPV